MFKFELGQLIYYIMDNEICSAPILCRMCIENAHEDWIATNEQRKLFALFGEGGIYYSTCHGIISEDKAFVDQEELIRS